MKIIVRVDLVTDRGDTTTVQVDQIERPSQTLEADLIDLSPQVGKRHLGILQQAVIRAQTEVCQRRRVGQRCHRWTGLKAMLMKIHGAGA